MHATGERREHRPAMVQGRSADPQRVELLVLEHVLPAGVGPRAPGPRDRLGPLDRGVARRDELDARCGIDRRNVDAGDPPAADDARAKRRHRGG